MMTSRISNALSLTVLMALAAGRANAADKLAKPAPSAPNAASKTTLTEKHDGQTIAAHPGDSLEVRLQSNITTGYSWSLAKADAQIVKLVGEPQYLAPQTKRPGAGGIQIFRFQILKTGATALKLQYARPWEKDTAPARTFAVTLKVK